MSNKAAQIDSLKHYANLIQKQTGRVVRPYRYDGYVNMMNKYGTSRDTSERYEFKQEPLVPDEMLTMYYEGNGLFAKIIDSPAEEAIKHGFELEGLKDQALEDFYVDALEDLDWEENVMTAVKWARLFGGSIAVLMIDDGGGLEDPLNWRDIRSVDDIRIYDRSIVQPDYSSMFQYNPDDPFGTRGSRLGMPEYYTVSSRYGQFKVHDSRCLVFQNGVLPERTTSTVYQMWGIPEYVRLKRAIRDTEIAHGTAPKLLDRSIQAIYKMRDLSAELATEEGEDRILRRLQVIDMARGLLNSIAIDSEGEDYDFKTFTFTGVSDVIDATCNFLSALTSIPQTILFGRSPAGMNSTGTSDLENWYNYLERIQNRMVKKNLRYLLSIIFQAGVSNGTIDEIPPIKVKFNPLWSLSEQEEAALEQTKAATEKTKAETAQIYVDMQAIDPSEVRKKLAQSDDFDVEELLDEYTEEEVMENAPSNQQPMEGAPGAEQGNSAEIPPEIPPENPETGEAEPSAEEENKDEDPEGAYEDTLRNAWLGISPKKESEDTLKNAWLGESEEKEQKKGEEDTLRNAWLGTGPKEETDEEEPADTLKDAWLGEQADEYHEKEDEDTLRNAWLGTSPNSSKAPGEAPKRSKDNLIRAVNNLKREYRAASREDSKTTGAVGVIVVKDGKILTGIRGHGDGEYLVCGPGGHVEEGETAGQAAIRETQEEFGITPMELIPIGKGEKQSNGLHPDLFLCVRYEGTPKCDEDEMHQARFASIEEIENSGRLFPPFEAGINALKKKINGNDYLKEKNIDNGGSYATIKSNKTNTDGGEGSGNFGHEGRPGERGGSAPNGGSSESEGVHASSGSKGSNSNGYEKPKYVKSGAEFSRVIGGPVTKETLEYGTHTFRAGDFEYKTGYLTIANKDGEELIYDHNSKAYFNTSTGEVVEESEIIDNPDYKVESLGGITKELCEFAEEKGYKIDGSFAAINPYVTEEMVSAYNDAEEYFPELKGSDITIRSDIEHGEGATAYVRRFRDSDRVEYAFCESLTSAYSSKEIERVMKEEETPKEEYGGKSWTVQTPEYISGAYAVSMHEIGHVVQARMDHWFDGCDARAVRAYKDFLHDYFYRMTDYVGAYEGRSAYSGQNENELFAEGFCAHACGARTPFADTTGKILSGWRRIFSKMSKAEFERLWLQPDFESGYDLISDILKG